MAVCEYLEWDSNFFGVRIGRVAGNRLLPEDAPKIRAWCGENRIDCLYFLADPEPNSIRTAESLGFHLTDIRLTLEATPGNTATASAVTVRPAIADDIPTLRQIAGSSHADSRFYQDGGFARACCDELYRIWIEKSCRGGSELVLVAEHEARPAGYVTCEIAGDRGAIGLIAVAPEARGVGLGSALVAHALDGMRSRGVRTVSVVTQGRNVRAQRLYQAHGFTNASLQLWYHLWPSRPNR